MSAPSEPPTSLSRDDLAARYLDALPYAPYPVQEEALLTWFSTDEGMLVSAPTGTGKTLIAEAAVFEALHTGRTMYYTTPLIALTDQKFFELQDAAERWGFPRDAVGLVTGNRRVNPDAHVLVVVAEILLNRLLHPEAFDFANVSAVVMDEFHSFSDPERGIVWEFSLSLLPKHVRLMLLSATVGNANPFVTWFDRCHGRRLELVVGTERKVPLQYQWVADKMLTEHLEDMSSEDPEARRTPALVFCFNREECWSVAEELRGKQVLNSGQQKELAARLPQYDLSKGVGPKLKSILLRGVGVHHAGLLPRYRRIVEELFQEKLLSVCVCTETLSAGINLPARSVVMTNLLKGPPGKQRLIDASLAHQIFGRAGRPQFDKIGYVYAIPHEDDVRILRWKEKYDQIPEDTKDPNLIRAKKAMKKKMPTRSPNRQYWDSAQFDKLKVAPPRDLVSQGPLPWRLLAYMLKLSSDVDRVRQLVRKRLMEPKRLERADEQLDEMLLTMYQAGLVWLDPPPPAKETPAAAEEQPAAAEPAPEPEKRSWLSQQLQSAMDAERKAAGKATGTQLAEKDAPKADRYKAKSAVPTERMQEFFVFRSINPVFAMFLLPLLAEADPDERLQIFESVLEFPRSLLRTVRVPPPHRKPPGPLAINRVDPEIIARGILPAGDLYPEFDPTDLPEERKFAPSLAEKLHLIFQAEYPDAHDFQIIPVWVAGDLRDFNFDFHKYVSARELTRQEGLVFKHLLRLVLLLDEFADVAPPGLDPREWRHDLRALARDLTQACQMADPMTTEIMLTTAESSDVLQGDIHEIPSRPVPEIPVPVETPDVSADPPIEEDEFGAGLIDEA